MNRLIVVILLALFSHQSAFGAIVFTFNYNDPAGQGFNDAASGATRRSALDLAARNFATAFSSYSATLNLDVAGTATGSTLAAAGDAGAPTFMPGFGGGVIQTKILGGSDLNGTAADGSVTVNFATVGWELDINATPMGNDFDWYSTMYHEFAHAVGFASDIQTDASGNNARDPFGTVGANNGDFGSFDEFLSDSAGNSVFTSGSDLNESAYEALLKGGASPGNGLFFNGANARAANGGNPVGLYSPTTYEGGSSGSHLDDQNPGLAGQMMLAATGPGLSARLFSDVELGMFRDFGYTNVSQINPVPEPSSFLLTGTIALVIGFRRRTRVT